VVKALKPLELIKDGQFKVETRMDKEKGKDKVEVTLSSNPNSDKLAVAATAAAKTKPTVTH
jgi:ASC-1-like (ASCH) protein